MDKEKILSQNKKENLYLDEYEKHIKLQGKSFGLMFVLFICILILFIKAVCKEPYYLALWVMKHIFQKINPNLLLLYSFFYLWGITFINF